MRKKKILKVKRNRNYCHFRSLKHVCALKLWYDKIRKWEHWDWTILRRSIQLSSAQVTKALQAFTQIADGFQHLPHSSSAQGSSKFVHTPLWPWPCNYWAGCPVLHCSPAPAFSSSAALNTGRGFKTNPPYCIFQWKTNRWPCALAVN